METTRFEIGKSYKMHSLCNHDCVWIFEVVARTAKTITLKDENGQLKKCRVSELWGEEICRPLGSYSMSPALMAGRTA